VESVVDRTVKAVTESCDGDEIQQIIDRLRSALLLPDAAAGNVSAIFTVIVYPSAVSKLIWTLSKELSGRCTKLGHRNLAKEERPYLSYW
jgi:hypothetical protein